jgi:SAM-dependent methyltransferase
MHPDVFRSFDRICRAQGATGHVLEIGARPSPDTLLCLPALGGATQRVGIDLDGPHQWNGIGILAGNANCMPMFADASFDAVLCNAVLEHDPQFWRTLGEIGRVLKPGGLFVVGVPGYGAMGLTPFRRLIALLRYCPGFARGMGLLRVSSATLGLHDFPGDYYRFSKQAVTEVFLAGYERIEAISLLMPPRFIGWGRKPAVIRPRL